MGVVEAAVEVSLRVARRLPAAAEVVVVRLGLRRYSSLHRLARPRLIRWAAGAHRAGQGLLAELVATAASAVARSLSRRLMAAVLAEAVVMPQHPAVVAVEV